MNIIQQKHVSVNDPLTVVLSIWWYLISLTYWQSKCHKAFGRMLKTRYCRIMSAYKCKVAVKCKQLGKWCKNLGAGIINNNLSTVFTKKEQNKAVKWNHNNSMYNDWVLKSMTKYSSFKYCLIRYCFGTQYIRYSWNISVTKYVHSIF